MGKTADLTAVQKPIIDTLKREGKTQKEISERIAVPRVLYQGTSVGSLWEGKSVAKNAAQREEVTGP